MAARSDSTARTPSRELSRVPYLPGLDGLRAVAVVAVMLYHANHHWLPGGFLGVEVFFVISGYLITLLLIGEFERDGRVSLSGFWHRRFRRLLPALYVMMAMVALYITAFYSVSREQVRGDFMGGIFYVSNWYQIFVGQGYAAGEAMVPLRHLWSLAVEEQFYLIWPLVMVLILRRWRRNLPSMGVKLIALAFAISVAMGVLFSGGFVPLACTTENSHGYWHIFGRCISINDTLYLSSVTRAGGLMLGAGFAMLWRPAAIVRGPLRYKFRQLDIAAGVAMVGLLACFWFMYLFDNGLYDPWLFRGGFFLTGVLTLVIIAAASHHYAATGGLLGNPVFLWIGTRSYGLYLYHWPIYEIIRKQAQIPLSVPKFVLAMIITVPITEASYRFIETPIRKGRMKEMIAGIKRDPRKLLAGVTVAAVIGVAAISLSVADPHCVGSVACSLAANTDPETTVTQTTAVVNPGSSTSSTSTTTTLPPVPDKYVSIGESVMVGAIKELTGAGFVVNAKENRGAVGIRDAIIAMKNEGHIGKGTTLVIQVGTNGPVSDDQLNAILGAIPLNVKSVVFMTVHAQRFYIPDNNKKILALPTTHHTIQVIDWDKAAANVKLCSDGIHVVCYASGRIDYTNLILRQVGLPQLPGG